MAADDDYAWHPGQGVADDDTRPADDAEAVGEDADRGAVRLEPVYVRLREILHRTRAGSNAEPSPRLPGMEAY
jgi:hypothetical protein